MRRRIAVAITAVLAVAGIIVGAGHSAAAPLPVTYNFLDGISAELRHPGGSLPGTNDFRCKPTAAHPRPVVLVHGTGGGRQTNWATLAPVLKNAGYCVFALTYNPISRTWPGSALGGLGDKVDGAWQIKLFAEKVLAATGARQVDIVGHSQGTEVPTYWIKFLGGRGKVGAYVSLAPYWRDTGEDDKARLEALSFFLERLPPPASVVKPPCPECTSPPKDVTFNRAVREPTPYVTGIRYTNIVTRHDGLIDPYWLGLLNGPAGTQVRNIVVQDGCAADRSDHMSITSNRRSAAIVLGALDPEHAPPVPCVAVSPVTGG